jgi:hypothetical protein
MGGASSEVDGFSVSHARIVGNANSITGLQLVRAKNGVVIGNAITNHTAFGIGETGDCSDNLFLGNWLYGNASGPIVFSGTNSQAIRNVADATIEVPDSGGFRQTIDGWTISTTAVDGTEMNRFGAAAPGGRYRAARPGSVTGIVIESSASISSGSVTAEVYINTGTPDAAPSAPMATGDAVSLSSGTKNSDTQGMDIIPFDSHDEVFLMFQSSGTPTSATLRCSFEVEI